jgi:hypothetical protein
MQIYYSVFPESFFVKKLKHHLHVDGDKSKGQDKYLAFIAGLRI